MSNKSKKPPVDRATATTHLPLRTDADKVTLTRQLAQAMPASPDWTTSPALQALVKAWSADADAIEAQAKKAGDLRTQLRAVVAQQYANRRDWQVTKAQVMSTATGVCGGSADRLKALSLDVIEHARVGALAAPAGLAVNPGKLSGDITAAWTKGIAKHGFLAQHASNPADATTYSSSIACTRAKLTLHGMPSGSSISFRVAAIDPASPTGQSPWSAWVLGNVR
jgi:hypothetical protein